MSNNTPLATLRHSDAAAAWATSEERTLVFAVERESDREGDENGPILETVEYTMPAKPNPGLALKFLRMAREQGELANSWLIETAIGSDGYTALEDELINYEGDSVALLQSIIQKIQKVAMGGLEAPKG